MRNEGEDVDIESQNNDSEQICLEREQETKVYDHAEYKEDMDKELDHPQGTPDRPDERFEEESVNNNYKVSSSDSLQKGCGEIKVEAKQGTSSGIEGYFQYLRQSQIYPAEVKAEDTLPQQSVDIKDEYRDLSSTSKSDADKMAENPNCDVDRTVHQRETENISPVIEVDNTEVGTSSEQQHQSPSLRLDLPGVGSVGQNPMTLNSDSQGSKHSSHPLMSNHLPLHSPYISSPTSLPNAGPGVHSSLPAPGMSLYSPQRHLVSSMLAAPPMASHSNLYSQLLEFHKNIRSGGQTFLKNPYGM